MTRRKTAAQERPRGTPPQTRRVRIPDIAWIEIPAGSFVYQQGATRELPTFWIARYPVTNAQFQTFIDDYGYREDSWWRDLERPEPTAPTWTQDNRPRTDVDWYEAMAFTRWLTARLGLPEGSVRLPTELEWEKAARGEKGLIYPWGNEYRAGIANIDERVGKDGRWFLEQTTAVGMYPRGQSALGIEDLSGTVWEWCLSKFYRPDDKTADASGDFRCLRGGSWLNYAVSARADLRGRDLPENRNFSRGFRVLSSVPIAVRRFAVLLVAWMEWSGRLRQRQLGPRISPGRPSFPTATCQAQRNPGVDGRRAGLPGSTPGLRRADARFQKQHALRIENRESTAPVPGCPAPSRLHGGMTAPMRSLFPSSPANQNPRSIQAR